MSWQGFVVHKIVYYLTKIYDSGTEFDIVKRRNAIEKIAAKFKIPKGIINEKITIGHLSAEWFYLSQYKQKIILYIHGGGFVIGSTNTHRGMLGKIAQLTACRVLGVNYRLAPENPFPAALEDIFLAYNWLLQQNISPNDIILAGDSAGGNLAIVTALLLRDKNAPLPSAIACLSPWTDLTLSGESFLANTRTDPLLKKDIVMLAAKYYSSHTQSPMISPIFADLTGLPPLYIQISNTEVLFSDGVRLAEKAKSCGVSVELKIYSGMMHGWQFLYSWLPEAKQALKDLSAFILARL